MGNMILCQSCAMPMDDEKLYGTNSDGSNNKEYCSYCFKDGKFTANVTMKEMVEICIPHISNNNPYPDKDSARKAMNDLLPSLKRWK